MGNVSIREGSSASWWRWTLLVTCLSLASTLPAAATTILVIDGGGKLTGAKGVDVNGTLYDVAFVDGTCAALFAGCDEPTDFDWTTSDDAVAVSQKLLDQVFVDSPLGNFDSQPSLTFGCSVFLCNALTPFADLGPLFRAGTAGNWNPSGSDLAYSAGYSDATDYSGAPTYTFVKWTAQPAVPVPEPGTLGLLGISLTTTLLAGLRHRRQAIDARDL